VRREQRGREAEELLIPRKKEVLGGRDPATVNREFSTHEHMLTKANGERTIDVSD
jgi:hypothetical protein